MKYGYRNNARGARNPSQSSKTRKRNERFKKNQE